VARLIRSGSAGLAAALACLVWAIAAPAATLYVTNTKSGSIAVIDTNTLEVTQTIPVGSGKPNRIAFHPDVKIAWVIYDKSQDIGIVDAEAGRLLKRIRVGQNPYNLTFSPDGRYCYVLDWGDVDGVIA
jgi:YVTN family beta-propeller protein